MVGVGQETDKNLVARSLLHFAGVTVASEQLVPLWGPLFDLTGNYVQGVSLALDMLIWIMLVTGTLGGSSRGVGQILYSTLPVQDKGVSTPIMRRKG